MKSLQLFTWQQAERKYCVKEKNSFLETNNNFAPKWGWKQLQAPPSQIA